MPPAPPPDLPAAVAALLGEDESLWLPAAVAIRKAVSAHDDAPLQAVVDLGALPPLVALLSRDDLPELQVEAAWICCNVASGGSDACASVVAAGALAPAISHLGASGVQLREQVAWLLANVAGESELHRDACLEAGVVGPLMAALEAEVEAAPLRQQAWVLRNLLHRRPRSLEVVRAVLPGLSRLVPRLEDSEALTEALWAASAAAEEDPDRVAAAAAPAAARAAELLDTSAPVAVLLPAARLLGGLAIGSEAATQAVVDTGVLAGGFRALLAGPRAGAGPREGTADAQVPAAPPPMTEAEESQLLKEVCFTLSNIAAGTLAQAQAVVDAGLVPALAAVYDRCSDHGVHTEATYALSNLATAEGAPPELPLAVLAGGGAQRLAAYLRDSAGPGPEGRGKAQRAAAEGLLAIARAGDAEASATLYGMMDVYHDLVAALSHADADAGGEGDGLQPEVVGLLQELLDGWDMPPAPGGQSGAAKDADEKS
ncbi:hypothetical protein HYH03_012864 [Edaphochlamys debaryana]|uniref:Importin subunit alpha n=1 Tax=Edaphochlamys debaryana TaxID=47281 RepID=A0A836BTN9_9CHLO|nr:hypothetical protein HYH03_012864 [Edaphochlamys debaryana]|eukprot:KAG2488545.1 hypothetical protein HYH03_012864 [Edaphochlamys debaryana]